VGEKQAEALAKLFEQTGLVEVVSSPLRRACETAEPIASMSGARITVDDAFMDRDWGPWAGRPVAEVAAQFGSLDLATGVEPAASLTNRAFFGARDVLARVHGAPVAIVAHDAVNRALLARLADNTPRDPGAIPLRLGAWNRLERRGARWHATVVDALPGDGEVP
jgi:broad specificity phosphatase PhoE